METEKYYLRVGMFFVAVVAAFVYYLITFGGDQGHDRFKRYAIYFDNSVAGLTRGAPVKLKGITVGVIDEITFATKDTDRILITVDVVDSAPVNSSTVASITVQGIAGSAYLSLENRVGALPPIPLEAMKGQDYPVIKSERSSLQELISSAPEVMGRIAKTAEQTEKLLSDNNVAAVQALIAEAIGTLREIKMLARTIREDPSVIIRGSTHDGYQVEK